MPLYVVIGWTVSSPKLSGEILTPNVTLSGNRIITEVTMRLFDCPGLTGWCSDPTGRFGPRNTGGRKTMQGPRKNIVCMWRNRWAARSQGGGGQICLTALRRNQAPRYLTFGVPACETVHLCCLRHPFRYGSSKKRWHLNMQNMFAHSPADGHLGYSSFQLLLWVSMNTQQRCRDTGFHLSLVNI